MLICPPPPHQHEALLDKVLQGGSQTLLRDNLKGAYCTVCFEAGGLGGRPQMGLLPVLVEAVGLRVRFHRGLLLVLVEVVGLGGRPQRVLLPVLVEAV